MTSSHKAATTAAVSPPVAAPTSLLPLSPPDATLQYSIDFLDDSRDGGGAEGAEPGGENRASPSATIFSPFQASPASPPAPASDGDFIEPIALGFHSLRRKALPLGNARISRLFLCPVGCFEHISVFQRRRCRPNWTPFLASASTFTASCPPNTPRARKGRDWAKFARCTQKPKLK